MEVAKVKAATPAQAANGPMRVFFFYIGTPTPILETELELIRKHEALGDTVRVLQCSGNLPNCHWNQARDSFQCAACRSKFSNGWAVLKPGPNVELKQFPQRKFSSSELPAAFDSVEELKQFKHDGENIGFGVASGLISLLRDHRFDTRLHRDRVHRELRTSVQVYDTLKREFLEFKPDRVYLFNGRIATHLPGYVLCKRMGIECFSYEVANKNNSYRQRRHLRIHDPMTAEELRLLRSNWTQEHARIGEDVLRQRRLGKHLVKVPVFTAQQVQGLLPAGFDRNKRNIAIFNSTIDEYAGIEGWTSKIYEPDETAGVHRILETFESDDRFMFYLRVHPHMKEDASTTSQLMDIRKLSSRFANLRVIWPDHDIDSYALLDACEKVLTFGSTIGIEAAYWGKPSILAGRAYYENLDCVFAPGSHEEVVDLLRADLKPRDPESALIYFFWEVSEGIPFSHFRETGFRNGLATGTFDGIEIRPDALPEFGRQVSRFLRAATRALLNPTKAWVMLKRYAKTIY
jgi:hypothetical protein